MLRLALGPTHLYIQWTEGSFTLDIKMGLEDDHPPPHKVDVNRQIYLLLDRSFSHPKYVIPPPGE